MKDDVPYVRGKKAKKCIKPNCGMCKGAFAEVFAEWICPHCKAHLSKGTKVCLNMCGLSEASQKRFVSLVGKVAGGRLRSRTED